MMTATSCFRLAVGPDELSGARDAAAGGVEAGAAPSRWTGKRKLSLVLAAVGGAGLGLGLKASSLARRAEMNCDATTCKTLRAASDSRSAHNYAIPAKGMQLRPNAVPGKKASIVETAVQP
jgi:hypothetical protein